MARIRKGDQGLVVAGTEKGVEGKVITVLHEQDRVIVEGVNRVKKHTRAGQTGAEGGIITTEASIHISNVMPLADIDGKKTPTRVSSAVVDGKRTRVARKTGKEI